MEGNPIDDAFLPTGLFANQQNLEVLSIALMGLAFLEQPLFTPLTSLRSLFGERDP